MTEDKASKKYYDDHHDMYVEIFKKISSICREISSNPVKSCSDCAFMARDIWGNELGCIFDQKPNLYDGDAIIYKVHEHDEEEERRQEEEERRNRLYTLEEVKDLLNSCIQNSEKKSDWLEYVKELDERKK